MTVTQVLGDSRYLRLTSQQRVFVKTLCENSNDKIAAAKAAWSCKNDQSAATMANRAIRKPAIKKLLAEFFGEDITDERMTREELLSLAARRARLADKDADAFRYLTLIIDVEGWHRKPAEPVAAPIGEAENFEDLVRELEK